MHVIIHLLTARLPQTKEANYGYINIYIAT